MITKKFVLLDIDYVTRNRKPVIRLFGKILGDEYESIIALDKSFRPYFYVVPHDMGDCIDELNTLNLLKMEKVLRNDGGTSIGVLKVTLENPPDIPKYREKIKDFPSVKEIREHDIPFYRRYLIDKGISPMNMVEVQGKVLSAKSGTCKLEMEGSPKVFESDVPELKFLSFNIEVYNPQGMPQADRDPIVIISFSTNQGFRKVISTKNCLLSFVDTVPDEKSLMEKFVEIVQNENPDIILGYNSDAFDFPYLQERARQLGVTLNLGVDGSKLKFTRVGMGNAAMIRGRVHIDLYSNLRRYLQLDSYTLENVYKEFFREEKLDIPGDEIYRYWDAGGERLKNLLYYSLDDAVAVTEIGEKILPLNMELTRIVGQPLFEVARMASGRYVEWYLIKKSYEYGNLVPNKASTSELSRREDIHVEGSYVKEPIQGLHENIVYFDFRSLYPTVIIAKNISPDSLASDDGEEYYVAPEYGHRFRKTPQGFIPSAIEKILEDRIRIKSLMKESDDISQIQVLDVQQQALKRMANTIYGLYNHSTFRWYSLECSEAITSWGRDFLKKSMEDAEKHGFKPLYADTDGFFVTYKD